MRVIVSYSHQQGQWVWDRLVPVVRAGGAEVLIDRERFAAGKGVAGQMDALQDRATGPLPLTRASPRVRSSRSSGSTASSLPH